jgi:proteasome accessory factor A
MYGSQENYECALATGWRWHAWRIGLGLLFPTLALLWLAALLEMVVVLVYYLVAALLYPLVGLVRRQAARLWRRTPDDAALRRILFGKGLMAGADSESDLDFLPAWLYTALYRSLHLISAPAALGLTVLGKFTAFVDVRRRLTPFLVTRAVFAGSGRLVAPGRFEIAAKGSALNRTAATNEVFGWRPMYSFGHFLKAFALGAFTTSRKFRPLLNPRQRLQISLGDGNLCEEAEYLRIGTTALVLDAIEAGALPPVPRFWRPLSAMRQIIADPTLTTRIRIRGGGRMSAIAVQRFYLNACRAFAARRPDAPPEAHDILRRWGEVLDLLQTDRSQLIGRIDWITKQFLLNECGGADDAASFAARKKIDLRYHELSTDGYFHRLRETGISSPVLSEREFDDAMRNPPPDTAAAVRGRYVREFASDPTARASWQCITVGTAPHVRVLDLTRHEVSAGSNATPGQSGSTLSTSRDS